MTQQLATRCLALLAKGFTAHDIAGMYRIPLSEVRKLTGPPEAMSRADRQLREERSRLLKSTPPQGRDPEEFRRCVLMNFGEA